MAFAAQPARGVRASNDNSALEFIGIQIIGLFAVAGLSLDVHALALAGLVSALGAAVAVVTGLLVPLLIGLVLLSLVLLLVLLITGCGPP